MAAYRSAGSRKAAFFLRHPRILAIFIIAAAIVLQNLVFAAHTAEVSEPANNTWIKNGTQQSFNFNVTFNTSSTDNITAINVSAPSGFSISTAAPLSSTGGFSCTNATGLVNCTNATGPGLGNDTLSVIIQVNATPQTTTGTYVWVVNTTDAALATNGYTTIVKVDAEAPTVYPVTVNVSSPTKLNTNFFINTSYNDGSGSGISACTYNVTNSSGAVVSWTYMASSGGTSGVANATISTTLPDGANSIYVNCSDSVGWVGYSSASTLTVDTAAPTVDVAQPSGVWVNGSVLVRITVNDSTSGAASVVFYNGSAWASAVLESGNLNNGIWNGTINTAAFSDGTSIQISANATDSAGNNGSDGSVPTIQVDNNPPVILAPTLNVSSPTRFNANIFVNSTFTDNGQGLTTDTCLLYVTGATTVSAYTVNNSAGTSGSINNTLTSALTDGTNNIYLNCTDQQGWTGSNFTSLIVDTIPPSVAVQSPIAKNYSTASIPLNFTVGDLNGVSSCKYELSNSSGSFNISLSNCQNVTLSGVTEGSNSVKVWANDSAGNLNVSMTVSFNVDTIKPAVAIQSPQNISYASLAVPLNFTVGDVSGISQCWYSLTGWASNVSLPNCQNTTITASEGGNTIRLAANDTLGNINNSVFVSFNVDTGYPSVSINSPDNQSWQRGTVPINYTATDAQTIDACSWRWRNSTGVWSVYNTINCGAYLAFNFNTVNCADNSSAVCVVEVRANDTANNVNSTEVYLKIDNSAPVVNVSQPVSGWFNGSMVVRIVVNDSTSGASSVIFFNGSVWASAVLESGSSNNGVWNGTIRTNAYSDGNSIIINANATDLLGNNGSDASVPTIQVDNNPPKILTPALNVSSPTNRNSNIFVNSTFNDNSGQGMSANTCLLYVSGATSISPYSINNSGGVSGSVNGTVSAILNDGTNNVFVNCTDQQGWTGSNFTSLLVDTVPPGIAVQLPIAKNYSTAAVPLNFTAGDLNGVSSCRYEIANSSGSFNVSLSGCQNATLAGVTEEGNTVKVWANDSAGNWNVSAAVSFTVDTIFPVCSAFSANASYARNGETVNFSAACTDAGTNISGVFFNLTAINSSVGVVQANSAGGSSYYFAASVGASDGSKAVSIFNASDNAGNVNSSLAQAAAIIVDNTNPSVANTSANVTAARTGTPINVSAIITDANLNASRLFVFNSTGGSFDMGPAGGNVYVAFITVTETGNNPSLQYNISAYDNASNLNNSAYVTFNLDNTAPTVNAPTVNVSSPTRLNKNFFINTSFSDGSGSGVVACSYNVTNSTGGFAVAWASMASSGGTSGVANATIAVTLPDGANSIFVNCSDNVGYNGFSSARVLTVDTIAPAWNQTPSSQTVGYGAPFSYQVNASDVALGSYYISDSANFSINSSSGLIRNNTFLSIGAYPLTVYVNDTVGNVNSSSITVTVSDSTLPVISGITVTPSIGTSGVSIIINATVVDVPPLTVKAKIQYVNKTNYAVVDYVVLNTSASGSNYNATWNTAGAYNGTYVVDINATDGGGNNVIVNDGASIALGYGAQSTYSNSSVSTDSLNQTSLSSANISLLIQANNSRQNDSITIVKYADDPSGSSLGDSFGATEIGAFADIVSSISGSNLSWALIKIYYTDAQLSGMLESQLGLYYWNGAQWQRLKVGMGWVYETGVNTTGDYVWANVSHLSLFAAAGDEQGPQASGIILSANPTYANVTFTALIEDVSLGGSDISAAEYYLGSDPGRGNGTAVYPQDGLGFDGNRSETVNGTIYVNALSNGAHTLYVRGRDAANNWGLLPDSYPFTVNKTAPTLNSIVINGNSTYAASTPTILTLSASGAYECAFSNDGSNYSAWDPYAATASWTLSGGDGVKTVYYKCKNSAGLEASAISDTIILDTTAPSINITAPAAGATANGNYSVNFTISDANGVSPQNVSISFDGAEWISTNSNFSYWWNTTTLQDGPHNIQILAVDSAGNTGESLVRLAYVNNEDQIAPALFAIGNGSVSDSSALIYWNTSEPADAQVEFGVASGSYIQSGLYAQNSTNHSVLLSSLQKSTLYFYRVLSRDASGNLNVSGEYNFTTSSVDTTAPVINITAPAGGSVVNGVVLVNYSISDSGGVNGSNVSIQFDGGGGWIQANSNFSYSWNTSLFLDGAHFLQVKAVDSSGNAGFSDLRLVYVNNPDRDAPGIFAVLNTTTSSSANISWNTTEPADALVEYGRSSGSYSWVTGTYGDNSTSHSVLISGLFSSTQYFYRIKSRDASGNLNTSQEFSFTTLYVDSSVPSVAIISPRGSDYVGLSKAISISASDASGINPTSMLLYKDGSLLWTYSTSECTGAGTLASPYLCSWTWNTTEEDDGMPHILMLSASDNAGESQTHSIMIYVDRVMPLVYPNSPSNNQYLYVSEPPVNFTVARGSQGLVNKTSIAVIVDGQQAMDFNPSSNCSLINGTNDYFCSFRITRYAYNQLGYLFNSSLMLGNHSLTVSASDLAGNNATPKYLNFTLLDENDTISLTGLSVDKPSAIANGQDYWQYTFSVTLGASAGTRVSFKLADWSDGYGQSISSSYANLTVGAGKIALSSSYQYSIPVSDENPSSAGVQSSLILKQYIPMGTLPNQYFTSYGIKTIDSESPTLSSTAPANNSFINYALSNVTATFSDSGGSGVYFDGSAIALSNESGLVAGTKTKSPPSALVLNFSSPLPDGNYTIATLPKDKYGNTGSLQYSYFVLDRVLPTAATLDALPIYTTSLRVSLNWSGGSDDRSGVSHYQLWRSSGTFVNIANTSGTAYNDTSVQDGVVYYYNISTVDRAGNARFSTFLPSTTIDITTPAAPTVAPLSTPTNIPTISVSGTAEAYSNVSIYVNGALERTTFTASGSFSFSGIVLSEGVNIINATATDLAGLVSAGSNKVSVLLDTTPPAIGSLFPVDGSNISSARPEISAVFTESGSGVNSSSIIMLVDDVQVSHSYEPASKKVSYTPSTPLSEAVHNISAYTRDLLGYSTLTTWSFRVDLTPPTPVSGLSVAQDTNSTMNLSWSASPALDFSYFRIYRKEIVSFTNVSQATFVNNLTSTSYRDSGLLPSRPYYYAVTAVDSVGNENATVTTKYNTTLS